MMNMMISEEEAGNLDYEPELTTEEARLNEATEFLTQAVEALAQADALLKDIGMEREKTDISKWVTWKNGTREKVTQELTVWDLAVHTQALIDALYARYQYEQRQREFEREMNRPTATARRVVAKAEAKREVA